MMNTSHTLGSVLYAFFEDHLRCQKGLRPATLQSYRDALRLFLQFTGADQGRRLTRLRLSDLTCEQVLRFLKHLEDKRSNGIATRNQRLAALHTFFEYLAGQAPDMLAEAQRVAAIPIKRTSPPRTRFLERDEIEALFESLPTNGRWALRDRTLLLFLYNTGARVQEVCDLCGSNLELGLKPRVRLHGKGDKWRVCPLWTQTATLLSAMLGHSLENPDAPVFVYRTGQALTRFGIYKIVRRHTAAISHAADNGQAIFPHCFRHTTAVQLLEAGVEINVIRAWLGHVSLETTNRYAEINSQMKARALEACEPPVNASEGFPRKPIWRDDQSLLEWLQSL